MQSVTLPAAASRFIDTHLFLLGRTVVTPASLLFFGALIFGSLVVARLVRAAVVRAFARGDVVDRGTGRFVGRLLQYVIAVGGIGAALQSLGVNVIAFFTAGAFVAVAVGFAMQNILQNFVSGVILLVERSLKPGDILDVGGRVVRITRLGLRATVARTRDDEDLIIPNAMLAQQIVTNYTLRDSTFRVRAAVDVRYGTDLDQVFAALLRAAESIEGRLEQPEPRALLIAFGASGISFEVSVWVHDPWGARVTLSKLNVAVWRELQSAQIGVPFPQLDVHFDRPPDGVPPADAPPAGAGPADVPPA